ncbi:MAG: long-chain fatty acid--CoA ligase [Bacteroidetes bacterium 4572_117]|nr:MAG: long-chain fatty acid--CoA ligase [Bacteroidetes bacterium 4572_117]
MEITRTFDLLDRYQQYFMKEDALVAKQDGKWKKYSTAQYIDYAYNIGYGLLAMGFKKGDKIATISNNRPEWNFIDLGMALIGVVHVPLYTSLSADEYENILKHSDSRFVFISDKKLLKTLKPVTEKIASVESIYSFDLIENEKHWSEIVALGKKSEVYYKDELEEIKTNIKPDDFASLIYTSGTTGTSKGVMLSHRNMVENFLAAADVFAMKTEQKYLSILPLCHVGGRMGNYQTQHSGCSIYYAESMATIAADMREIKPHGFDAVPRILEKIFDTIISKGKKLEGAKKAIFFWAVKIGLKYKPPGESSWLYKMKLKLADKLIFSKWREAIGGNIESVGCGGAALQARIERVFWAAGIKVLNMYGLTETSPIITINRKEKPNLRLGSVGSIIDGVELKLANDGEILCKGHNVMLGYYKDPELTKKVFTDDGWFCTGDIGRIEDDKFLFVTDRKKEIFKLSSGKFIVPQVIENKFKESLFIEQIMVIGEHEKFASAIIAPDYLYLRDWCRANNITIDSNSELIRNKQLIDIFNKEIQKFNKNVADFEKINRFRLIPDVWSPGTGELSPTLKLKRRIITQKYQELIDQIYIKQAV